MDSVTVAIGYNLEFDVMRIDDKLFDVDTIISESLLGFVTRTMEG